MKFIVFDELSAFDAGSLENLSAPLGKTKEIMESLKKRSKGELNMTRYKMWSGDTIFVKKLEAGDFCIFSENPRTRKQERICHTLLPITKNFEESQKHLDAYAANRSLEKIPDEMAS